jgi:hypothetical protein
MARTSRPFWLAARPGDRVVLDVSVQWRGAATAALVTGAVGLLAAGIGTFWLIFAPNGPCTAMEAGGCVTSSLSQQQLGAVITDVAGLGLIATSMILISIPRARATQAVPAPLAPEKPPTAWLRVPTWHDPVARVPSLPAAAGFPLFERSF